METVISKPNLLDEKEKKSKKKRKTRSQRFKEKNKQVRGEQLYAPIIKQNDNLVTYYKHQKLVKEDEFDAFIDSLRNSLPASFRINTFDIGQAIFLRSYIGGPILEKLKASVARKNEEDSSCMPHISEKCSGINRLVWYPKRLAWQLDITKLDLRKISEFRDFHNFLMAETDNGFISRQEAVSMIPPLLLDVQPGHYVLDMCAAPGSKTAQLLENIKSGQLNHNDNTLTLRKSTANIDDGLVVANDADNKRCYMLVHQSNRLNSPNCVIINEDASKLSDLKINDAGEKKNLLFDRVLCDVPCCGDGTLRKNPEIWRKWNVGNSNNFHGLQTKILRRGVELLKKDGLLVYSTCSMNPIENEAVVAAVLRYAKGGLQLEDISAKLPGLKTSPGLSTWTVMNRDMDVLTNFSDVKPDHVSNTYPSLFPPTQLEVDQFKLDRCMRILPHFQNTGGFFVAVFKKLVDLLNWQEEKSIKNDETKFVKTDKKRRYGGFKEDPFIFVEEDDEDWLSIKESFGFSQDFPCTQLMHRCKIGKKRSIYLVSKSSRDFIKSNQEDENNKDSIKVINGGMRIFNRTTSGDAGFRICQDAINEVVHLISDDLKVFIYEVDVLLMLKHRKVLIEHLTSDAARKVKDKIKLGSFIFIFNHEVRENSIITKIDLPLVAWKGEVSVSLYVSDKFKVHLAAIVGLNTQEVLCKPEVPT